MNSRRQFLGVAIAGLALLSARPSSALSGPEAKALIEKSLAEVTAVIEGGHPPDRMYREFEAIFARYADVDIIARSALGPAARQVGSAQFTAYRQAFQGYIGRKYGKRFHEFYGAEIQVGEAKPLKSFYAVQSTIFLRGRQAMTVEWHVSDKSGRNLYFNIIIEGINMLATERAEIGAMLARRKGDVAALTADLTQAG